MSIYKLTALSVCVTVQYIPAGSRGQHSTHVRHIWLLQAGRPLLCQSTGEQEMTLFSVGGQDFN